MAIPSYSYTLTNNTTADATQVQQNFTDILNGVTDSTKDILVNNLTVAGTATFNGNMIFGNSSVDTVTVIATFGTFPLTGYTDASSAAAGVVGEVLTATATSVATSSTVALNVVTLNLTAGDWEVFASAHCQRSTGGTRAFTYLQCSLSTTSATQAATEYQGVFDATGLSPCDNMSVPVPSRYFSVSTSTPVYLVVVAIFSGTSSTTDGQIHARRLR